MNDAIRKAEVLIEALSYIRTFRGRVTVIKLGGSAMEDPDVLRATLQDVVFMETVDMPPVLVHGGGKAIDRAMADAGLVPRKVQGLRYTDEPTLAIVVRVVPSLALDAEGRWLNVNADTAAAAVAAALKAEKMVVLTDTPGILMDRRDDRSLIGSLDAAGCRELIGKGVIESGMIPKVEACLDSLKAGVKKTHMIDGRLRHSLLLEIYTDRGVGTEIVLGS